MTNSSNSDDRLLKQLIPLIKDEGKLSEVAENEIISFFDSRGEKATKVLREKKLHKLVLNNDMAIWEVEGKNKTYTIIADNYCECTDFQIRVLGRGDKKLCYHLLAKIIGELLKIYDSKKITSEEYDKLLDSKI
ncbi:MAG: hypothetical protein V3V41_06895 [Candidatus Heimdallarchaeota archaeon]